LATELNRTFSKGEIQTAKKHMKKCSPSLAIKEMQIKTTLRFHFTLVRIAITKNTTNNRSWRGCGGKRNHHTLLVVLYDPAFPLLGIYPKECNTSYSRGTCTPVFIATLFTITKLWKQPRCPTTDEWIKKMWYLYTTEFYSAMKKNEIICK
jgi:hypothetical protein